MAKKQRKRLGEILEERGIVTPSSVVEAMEYSLNENVRIGEAFMALGFADEEDVARALATQFDMEYVDLDVQIIDANALTALPEDRIRRHLVLPMGRDEQERLKVIVTDPIDLETLDMLRFLLGEDPVLCLGCPGKVRAYIENNVGVEISVDDAVGQFGEGSHLGEDGLITAPDEELTEDGAPIVRLVTMIIMG